MSTNTTTTKTETKTISFDELNRYFYSDNRYRYLDDNGHEMASLTLKIDNAMGLDNATVAEPQILWGSSGSDGSIEHATNQMLAIAQAINDAKHFKYIGYKVI